MVLYVIFIALIVGVLLLLLFFFGQRSELAGWADCSWSNGSEIKGERAEWIKSHLHTYQAAKSPIQTNHLRWMDLRATTANILLVALSLFLVLLLLNIAFQWELYITVSECQVEHATYAAPAAAIETFIRCNIVCNRVGTTETLRMVMIGLIVHRIHEMVPPTAH